MMEGFQFVSAEVQLLKLADGAQTEEELVWVHQHAITIEVVGGQVKFLKLLEERKVAWQCAEVIGSHV